MMPVPDSTAALQAWLAQHPRYAYTVAAWEQAPGGNDATATFRVTYDSTSKVQTVHIISGQGAGADIRWSGGDTVDVRAPGLAHMFTVHLAVRAPQIISPRGNDIRTANLSLIAACFVADAAHVEAATTDDTLTLTDLDPHCGVDANDDSVTSDRLTLDPTDGHPIMRERFAGPTLVERWTIEDLQTS